MSDDAEQSARQSDYCAQAKANKIAGTLCLTLLVLFCINKQLWKPHQLQCPVIHSEGESTHLLQPHSHKLDGTIWP